MTQVGDIILLCENILMKIMYSIQCSLLLAVESSLHSLPLQHCIETNKQKTKHEHERFLKISVVLRGKLIRFEKLNISSRDNESINFWFATRFSRKKVTLNLSVLLISHQNSKRKMYSVLEASG